MYFKEHVIEQIREHNDIVSIISEYMTLTKKGNSYVGLCPFHNEKTPSFTVSQEKQLYYCFGCGNGGNIITFLMQKDNMNFVEAVRYLAERANIRIEEEQLTKEEIQLKQKKERLFQLYKDTANFYYILLRRSENSEVLDYLIKRNLSLDTINKFGIGYAPSNYNTLYSYLIDKGYDRDILINSGLLMKSQKSNLLFDRFSSRVIFPILNIDKKVIAFGGRVLDNTLPKYLNSPETLIFDKSKTLYGLNFAKLNAHDYYILVEGYMDVIAMHQAGFTQTVASLGTALTSFQARILKRYTDKVVIMYDSDEAGIKATLRAIPILKSQGIEVKVLQLEGGKDPDEYIKSHGKEELSKLLDHAASEIWFRISRIEKEYNLQVTEEKIEFLKQVSKLIGEMESSIEQSLYIEDICRKYSVEKLAFLAEVKRQEMSNKSSDKYNQTFRKHTEEISLKETRSKKLNNEIEFLAVLYHHPNMFLKIKNYVSVELFSTDLLKELAKEIFLSFETNKEPNINYFISKYSDVEEQKIISSIFMNQDERYFDTVLLNKMLLDNIKILNKNYIEAKLKTITDVTEIQNLLFKKKELDRLYIDFING